MNKNFPSPLIICLCLAVIFEAFNAAYDDYFYFMETKTDVGVFSGLDGFRMKIKNEISRDKNNAYDTIVLGDSYFISGILPDVFEHETGLSMFNFASFGNHGVFASYILLKNYLDNCRVTPKYLIMGYQPDTLTNKETNPGLMYDLKNGNTLLLMREYGLAEGIKFAIPSMKHQHFFKSLVFSSAGRERITKGEIRAFRNQVLAERGHYALYPDRALAEKVRDEDYNKDYRFVVSKSSERNLLRILNLAAGYNVTILYIFPTYSEDWHALYNEYGLIEDYSRYLRRLNSGHMSFQTLHFQDDISDLALYSDRIHLNRIGAIKLTLLLAHSLPK